MSKHPKLSFEATIGLLFEVVVGILDHLHVHEPILIWLLYGVGIALIGDSILRGEWADRIRDSKKRKKTRIVSAGAALVVLVVFGIWIHSRIPNAAKIADAGPTEPKPAAKAQLTLQLLPISDGDTPTHITIRPNEPFTIQIANLGPEDAEGATLKLTVNDACRFTQIPDDFILQSGNGDFVQNDMRRIPSILKLRNIAEKFAVLCPKEDQQFRLGLSYWGCDGCPKDSKWDNSDSVIINIKH